MHYKTTGLISSNNDLPLLCLYIFWDETKRLETAMGSYLWHLKLIIVYGEGQWGWMGGSNEPPMVSATDSYAELSTSSSLAYEGVTYASMER